MNPRDNSPRVYDHYSWAEFERAVIFASYDHDLWPLINGTEELIPAPWTIPLDQPDHANVFLRQSAQYTKQQKRLALARSLLRVALDTPRPKDEFLPALRECSHPAVLYKEMESFFTEELDIRKAQLHEQYGQPHVYRRPGSRPS